MARGAALAILGSLTVVFLLAALVAWTSLDENAAGRSRAGE
jgi:hypothetical protein